MTWYFVKIVLFLIPIFITMKIYSPNASRQDFRSEFSPIKVDVHLEGRNRMRNLFYQEIPLFQHEPMKSYNTAKVLLMRKPRGWNIIILLRTYVTECWTWNIKQREVDIKSKNFSANDFRTAWLSKGLRLLFKRPCTTHIPSPPDLFRNYSQDKY